LIGAQKAGTTALAACLFGSGVCHGRILPGEPGFYFKEAHFFNIPSRFAQGADFYASRFQHCKREGLIMDATPNTLTEAQRVHSVYQACGQARRAALKIIVILRNPIERELSLYKHALRDHGGANADSWSQHLLLDSDGSVKSFDNFTQGTLRKTHELWTDDVSHSFGFYARHLKQWFDAFDRSQILVLSYDELNADPPKTLGRLEGFLNVKIKITPHRLNIPLKTSIVPLTCTVRQRLEQLFFQVNEELYRLLEQYPGTIFEQRPFPRFKQVSCIEGLGH